MLHKDLLDAVLHCAVILVEQLTKAADIKAAHYHDDEVHVRQILDSSGLASKGEMELTAVPIRAKLGNCIRRYWKHWCVVLINNYLI